MKDRPAELTTPFAGGAAPGGRGFRLVLAYRYWLGVNPSQRAPAPGREGYADAKGEVNP